MTVKTGSAWAGLFVTLDATGALAAGTPSGVLYVDGTANGATVTITGSNPYKWAVTLPSLTAGQRVDMYITATISTIATASVVASEQADTVLLSEVKTDTAAILADTGTDGVVLKAAGLATDAVAEIADGVWDEALAGHISAGTAGLAQGSIDDVRSAAENTEFYVADLADGGRLDLLIDSIVADTNELQTDWANGGRLDLLLDGASAPSAADVADAVLDEAMAGHVSAGTLGKAVADILEDTGTTLDTLVKDIPTNAELATALGTADDAVLAAVAAAKTVIDDIHNTDLPAVKAETALIVEDTGTTLPATLASILEDTGTTLPAAIIAGSAGSGATAKSYTVTSGGLPLSGVHVWATTDLAGANIAASGYTNDSGTVTFFLDSGTTYYIWKQKQGYNFSNPDLEIA